MTQVAFHFGAPDRMRYTSRLLRKIASSGATAVVWAQPQVLPSLEQSLWSVGATDFVPHATDAAGPAVVKRSGILLTAELTMGALMQRDVLVNLHPDLPPNYGEFGRVIEVVSLDGPDRDSARSKWRQYTAAGHAIVRHDLQLKESAA